jgi:hypothetical protein
LRVIAIYADSATPDQERFGVSSGAARHFGDKIKGNREQGTGNREQGVGE